MNIAFEQTVNVLSEQPNLGRYVLAGSFGRAARLGDSEFPVISNGSLRDLDLVDMRGDARSMIKTSDGAPLDFQLTQRVRPLNEKEWGLFDPLDENGDALTSFDPELLGISEVKLPYAGGRQLQVFGVCGQLALLDIGPRWDVFRKHEGQKRALQQQHPTMLGTCACQPLRRAMDQYHNALDAKYVASGPEKAYRLVRGLAKTVAPRAFMLVRESRVGTVVRSARGTDYQLRQLPRLQDVPELAV